MVIGTTVVGLFGIVAAVAPGSPIWLRIVGGLIGLGFFLGLSEIRTGLRSKRSSAGVPAPMASAATTAAANPNVLQPAEKRRQRTGPGRLAAGLMVLAVGVGVLGVVWISQIGSIEEETGALEADLNAAGLRLAEAESDLATLEGETAEMEDRAAAERADAARLAAEAGALESDLAVRAAAFEASIADELALAGTLVQYEDLLHALADLDRDVARALAVVDATFVLGVEAGNRRAVGELESAISLTALETLLADLEEAVSALEAARTEVGLLPELLPPTEEGGDG
jgi:hypothetical protein